MLARLAWLLPALLLAAIGTARAQELDSVVKKLQLTHTLTIGYRETSVPLSYLDKDNKPTGYAVEICQDIGEAAKAALNLPELKFTYVPVNIQTRQPLIANGTVDIVCDGTVHTWTRAKQVDFTPIHWVSAEQLLVLKSSGIKDIADLKGKIVAIATGGTSEPTAAALNDKEHLGVRIMRVNDHPAGLLAVESRRADAYLSDNAAFYSLIQASHHPENLAIVGPELSYQPEALIIPKNNPTFKWIAGHKMSEMFKSGDAEALVKKWFGPFGQGVGPRLRAAWDTYSFPE
jgi:glutamate/aspartate transport system substrate-binding protein